MATDRQRLNLALIKEGYDIEHNRYPEGYQEAPLAYDAVWSVALAFNKTMERLKVKSRSLKDFTYTDKDIADEIYAAMNSTQFLGVSVSALLSIKITINFTLILFARFFFSSCITRGKKTPPFLRAIKVKTIVIFPGREML
jgi:hypothetical protein